MNHKQLISRDIEIFYNNASEDTRLEKGMGIFEFERNKELIGQYLPESPVKILDIGGGTGKYASWLAKLGHHVELVDPVAKHLRIAQQRANKLKNKFSVHLGEARSLAFPKNFADMIILHGPLYHLQKREDREAAIREAKRVVKKGGIILGFAISYTGSTLVGLLHGLIHKKTFFQMCQEELKNGTHSPPNDFPWLLAEAFYHKPQQLIEEFTSQHLTHIQIHAVEGIAWLDKNYFCNMLQEEKKKTLTALVQLTENDPYLLPFSPHMMVAVKKTN